MSTRARIATVCQGNRFYPSVEQNRDHVLGLLDLALRGNPDLVCLPESFTNPSHKAPARKEAEEVPGPTTDAIAALARHHKCYVICPLLTRRDGRVYNSAVLIGRDGGIIGVYDKHQPVTTSCDYTVMEQGITPGLGDGIFDLDFGRIGIRICFDVGFPDDWAAMARQGARLVVWPSAYNGGLPLNAYAVLHGYYVATSVQSDRSRIIDPCGATLAETDRWMNVVVRDINLDYAVCHYDFNWGIPDRILADYAGRVGVRSYPDASTFLVEPIDPEVTISGLAEKYGFEPSALYHRRHAKAYEELHRGEPPEAQNAAHGQRPMYAK